MLREKEKTHDPKDHPFSRKIFRAFGYWPTCSDDHMGEYLQYGYESGMHGYDFDADDRRHVETKQIIRDIMEGKKDARDLLKKSGEKAIDAIIALHTGRRTEIPAAIVYNGGAITNLPDDLAVEIPVVVDGGGIHKVHVGKVPEGAASLMMLQVGPQQMAVEAAVHGDRQMALQALLVDPVINSTDAAVKILDELWEINKPYIKNVL